jgi:transposase
MQYYYEWLDAIKDQPWLRLKFADEAHFVSRDLYRNLVVGPKGDKVYVVQEAPLELSFSLTLLIDLTNPYNPFHVNIRYKSNTEWDFLEFVLDALEHGRLTDGDLFIVDNASIHFGSQTWQLLTALLRVYNVKLIFLPKYSPELNPCELVFAYVKKYIRSNRMPHFFLYQLILQALTQLHYFSLLSFYEHCTQLGDRIEPLELN